MERLYLVGTGGVGVHELGGDVLGLGEGEVGDAVSRLFAGFVFWLQGVAVVLKHEDDGLAFITGEELGRFACGDVVVESIIDLLVAIRQTTALREGEAGDVIALTKVIKRGGGAATVERGVLPAARVHDSLDHLDGRAPPCADFLLNAQHLGHVAIRAPALAFLRGSGIAVSHAVDG